MRFSSSEDRGRILENIAFMELRRRYETIYYHSDKTECDFAIMTGHAVSHCFQVCWTVGNKDTLERDIQGLLGALNAYKLKQGMILINDELPETRTYLAILESIGCGNQSPKTISEKCGIPLIHVGKYLNTLQNLAFVRRTVTIDANDPAHSRISPYEINDAFLNFHFTLLRQYLAIIDQNRTGTVIEEITSRFNVFIARNGFERICRKLIMVSGDAKRLPFEPLEVGRLWNREVEIDVAAIDKKSKSVLLGECKWTERPISCDIFDELRNKARSLKSIASFKMHFALFSKSGFTKDVEEKAKRENPLLFSVKDMGL